GLPMAEGAGDLLRAFGVVPEVGGTGLFTETGDIGTELLDVDDLGDIAVGLTEVRDLGGEIKFEHDLPRLSRPSRGLTIPRDTVGQCVRGRRRFSGSTGPWYISRPCCSRSARAPCCRSSRS